MIVFKSKKILTEGKNTFEKSLNKRLINTNQSSFHIFPFSLFTKSFYKDFKKSEKGVFIGEIKNGQFSISPSSKIFSTRNWLPLKISGNYENSKVIVKYLVPNLFLAITIALIVVDIFFITSEMKFDKLILILAGFILVAYWFKIQRNNRIIKDICK